MTKVKICGIRRAEDAIVALEAGADFLGLVFAPSRRRIDPLAARDLVAQIKETAPSKIVGVFVNSDPDEINRIAKICHLDYAQLSGSGTDDSLGALDLPAIQVFHVGRDGIDAALAHRVERSRAHLVMLDTAQKNSYGGTGKTFAWAGGTRIERPFFLAGGLHPENAADAIRALAPWALDVSSGVETEGEKDPEKIRSFIARVQALTA